MVYILYKIHIIRSDCDEQVEKLADHWNIQKSKKDDAINLKTLKGSMNFYCGWNSNLSGKKVRDWVNFFKDEAKLKEFDQWMVIIITNLELLYCIICEIP